VTYPLCFAVQGNQVGRWFDLKRTAHRQSIAQMERRFFCQKIVLMVLCVFVFLCNTRRRRTQQAKSEAAETSGLRAHTGCPARVATPTQERSRTRLTPARPALAHTGYVGVVAELVVTRDLCSGEWRRTPFMATT
jgi:hypothetical protein